VKSSAYRTRDRYRLSATGSNHHSRHVYTPEEIDFLIAFVVTRNVWYVIPVTALLAKNINFYPEDRTSRGRYEKYREAWHQLGGWKV
jgi:hypothetical protein